MSLTTVFTPPASCLSQTFLYTGDNQEFYTLGPIGSPDCFPDGWATSVTYSPGVCPSGYNIACNYTSIVGNISATIATCCPNGYHCQKTPYVPFGYLQNTDHACGSPFVDVITVTGSDATTTYAVNDVKTVTELMMPASDSFVTAFTVTQLLGGINAYGVVVEWQSTDASILSTLFPGATSSPPATTTSVTTAGKSTTTSSSAPGSTTSAQPAGLTEGAKIGIGVSIPLGFLALFLFSFYLYRRKRARGTNPAPAPLGSGQNEVYVKSELGADSMRYELDTGTGYQRGGMETIRTHGGEPQWSQPAAKVSQP